MDISQFRSTDLFIPILGKTGSVTILETNDAMMYEIDQYNYLPKKRW